MCAKSQHLNNLSIMFDGINVQMDKASIVGDAVLYVQDLQMKAKKLKTEIADLEASLTGAERQDQESTGNTKKTRVRSKKNPTCKKIMQVQSILKHVLENSRILSSSFLELN